MRSRCGVEVEGCTHACTQWPVTIFLELTLAKFSVDRSQSLVPLFMNVMLMYGNEQNLLYEIPSEQTRSERGPN